MSQQNKKRVALMVDMQRDGEESVSFDERSTYADRATEFAVIFGIASHRLNLLLESGMFEGSEEEIENMKAGMEELATSMGITAFEADESGKTDQEKREQS